MTRVAKALLYDDAGFALVLRRSGTHPHYAFEPDLPGGVVETGESYESGLLRELQEEIGLAPAEADLQLITRSRHLVYGEKQLFLIQFDHRPNIAISWEHDRYEWVAPDALMKALESRDGYMRFVQNSLQK